MGFSLRTTDPRLPQEDTGPGGDRGCRFCNIMMAHPRRVTDGCFQKSRQAARRHPPGMKMAVLKVVPLGKGMEALRKLPPRILRQGVLVGPTPALSRLFGPSPTNTPTTPAVAVGPASPPQLRRGTYFQGSCSCRLERRHVRSKQRPPLDKGGLQGGFWAVIDNLVGCSSGNPPWRFAPPLRGRGFSREFAVSFSVAHDEVPTAW
jgi:hypothetical protein